MTEERLDLTEDHAMAHNHPSEAVKEGPQRVLHPIGLLLAKPGAIELAERLQIDGRA
jgi:hypothetical protein